MASLRHPLVAVAVALSLTLPWIGIWASGNGFGAGPTVAISGIAVLGASFLLAWAAETAEADVPRSFAIAVLAVLAVAPEYAVDALYAFEAGAQAGTTRGAEAGNLAIANMTGANRILIGLGWSGIALFTLHRARRVADTSVREREGWFTNAVTLHQGISVEIAFLGIATLWAFFVPFMGGIDIVDTIVLVGLYVAYIVVVIRAGAETVDEHVGVPAYLQDFARRFRIPIVIGLFAYSGATILVAVEPFAHGLEDLGVAFGLPEFFMIQWIAPLASESPELIVVAVLVMKSRSTAGFNALISSKLNQWTLLIGTLAIVYSIGYGGYGVLAFDFKQDLEIWITAAQSLFALAILVNLEISGREALVLLFLFLSQVILEFLVLRILSVANPEALSHQILIGYTVVYVVLAAIMFYCRRAAVAELASIGQATARRAVYGKAKPEAE
ncbi:sodium:calcium antiporter [Halovivax limisalsi]|uniref:sodium:calcium antiporter n=1 Tax=Halovivax limisalsi TaxID=1453760 RepID=UPI001FFC98B8|nr:sodium:calcium antiporter [Halovivax limisalsi]